MKRQCCTDCIKDHPTPISDHLIYQTLCTFSVRATQNAIGTRPGT
jgi:hypothetical protein